MSQYAFIALSFIACNAFAADPINYQDNVLPLFRDTCLNCHNPDKKKAGLDLSNFQSAIAGSNNGPVIAPGDPDGSLLFRVISHSEEPNMPPKQDKLAEKKLELIKAWIAGGALETKTGKPIASVKPRVDMAVKTLTLKRPDGPPPMPGNLVIEPVVHASRPWAVNCMAASPWAPVVAVGGQHQILLYNPQSFELLGVVPFTEGEPCVTRFSRNGKMLLIAGGVAAKSGKAALWDITTGKHVTDVGDEFDEVIAADISPDQSAVALGGPGKTLKLYSTQDGSAIASVKKHTDWITAIAYSPDGVLLASADRAGGLWVWEAKTAREFYNLAGHKAGVTAVAFRDDSNMLASASEDGTIKLWEMEGGRNVKTWNAHAGGVLSLAFTHDGRLVSCGRDRVTKIWKPDGSQLRQLDAFNDIALQATFDEDGKRVIAADWTGDVRVFDAETGKLVGRLDSNPAPIADRIAATQKRLVELKGSHDQAAEKLATAQGEFDKINLGFLSAQAAVSAAKKDLEAAQKSASFRTTRVAELATALRNAQAQIGAATPDPAVPQSLSELADDLHRRTGELKDAAVALEKARAAGAAAEENLSPQANRVKQAAAELEKARATNALSDAQRSQATAELSRLKAAEFFLKVNAAQNDLAACQAEQERSVAALAAAQGELDKADATLSAAQKAQAESPARIAAREQEIADARKAQERAGDSATAARAAVEHKQASLARATEFAAQLADESAKSPEEKTLAEAAIRAKALISALSSDIDAASSAAASATQAAEAAAVTLASAQAALVKEQKEIDNGPATLAKLQEAAKHASADIAAKHALVESATKTTAQTKSHADQLRTEYEKMKT